MVNVYFFGPIKKKVRFSNKMRHMKFRRMFFVYNNYDVSNVSSLLDVMPSTPSSSGGSGPNTGRSAYSSDEELYYADQKQKKHVECIIGIAPNNVCDISYGNMVVMDVSCEFNVVPDAPIMAPVQSARKTLIPVGVRFDESVGKKDVIPAPSAPAPAPASAPQKESSEPFNALDDFYMDDALMNRKRSLKRLQPPPAVETASSSSAAKHDY